MSLIQQLIQSGQRIPTPYLGTPQPQGIQPFQQFLKTATPSLPPLQSQSLQFQPTGRQLQIQLHQNLPSAQQLQTKLETQLDQIQTKLSRTTLFSLQQYPIQSQLEVHLRDFLLRQNPHFQVLQHSGEGGDKSALVMLSFLALEKPFEKNKYPKQRKSGYYFPLDFRFAWEREDERENQREGNPSEAAL